MLFWQGIRDPLMFGFLPYPGFAEPALKVEISGLADSRVT